MNGLNIDVSQLIELIYETAEDVALWPTLIDACQLDTLQTKAVLESRFSKVLNFAEQHPSYEMEVARHLKRALKINQRFAEITQEAQFAQRTLDHLPMAVIRVTEDGQVLSRNELADKIFQSSTFFTLHNSYLSVGDASCEQQLKQIISNAIHGAAENAQSTCQLQDSNRNISLSMYAMRSTDDMGKQSCTLFVVTNLWSKFTSIKMIQELYKLTPAEARMTKLLVGGDSLQEIAAQLGVSQNTIRNQLKSVFVKTGTHRQAELVSLILSTPMQHVPDKESEMDVVKSEHAITGDRVRSQSLGSTSIITLKNGQRIEVLQIGDAQGIPVFYQHDSIFCWSWWDIVGEKVLADLGIRLIVAYRPGFGATDDYPQHNFRSWAFIIQEVANLFNIPRFAVLGCSTGGPFAAACAHFLAKRCVNLTLVSSIGPVESLRELENIRPAMSRMILGFAIVAPSIYKKFFRLLIDSIRKNSLKYLKQYISPWSTRDRELTADPDVLQSIHRCVDKIFQHKSPGMISESLLFANRWGFDLANIPATTTIWRGAQDNAISHELAKKLEVIPRSYVNELPGMGHLLFIDNWNKIFSNLKAQYQSSFSSSNASSKVVAQ